MSDSSCSTDNCQCAPARQETETTTAAKAQPQWQSRKTEEGAVVEIALPGVGKDALDLTTGSGFLKLSARRKATAASRLIQGPGSPDLYELGLRLAANLDGGNANAKFEDGVLTITLPLVEGAKPRRIEVA